MTCTDGGGPMARWVRVGVGLLSGAALAGGLVACGTDGAEIGSVLDERPDTVAGQTVPVRVPSASIELEVGDPVTEADGVSAPEGGEIVPIGWTVDRTPAGPLTGPHAFTGYDGATEISVLSDGEPVDLVTIEDAAGSNSGAFVVLPQGQGPVTFEVTYDGLTQTVATDGSREAGVAEVYYDDAADGVESDCAQAWQQSDVDLTCRVASWVLPYTPEEGWVEDGSVYVVVQPALDVNALVTGRQRDEVAFVSDASTLDGTAPRAPLEAGDAGEGSVQGLLVAAVPVAEQHRWQAELTFTVAEGERSGESIPLEATIPVG
ncbi:hypothetical protein FXB39_04690 [Nocardioides sp. BGMRC 2183]|nr:hypothetical protein FXB39_04690 [Nocardioides sp. BGMRC 2183]